MRSTELRTEVVHSHSQGVQAAAGIVLGAEAGDLGLELEAGVEEAGSSSPSNLVGRELE